MSEILLNDEFVAIPLNVGKVLGDFDEAVFLQFIYRWCLSAEKNNRDHNFKEGHYWTYMTYDEIHEQLPMFSVSKIKRMIKSVKEKGVLKVSSFNKTGYDRTNWYRVDVDALNELVDHKVKCTQSLGQNEPMEKFTVNRPIPKSSSKSSSKDLKDTATPEQSTETKQSPPQEKPKRYTVLTNGGYICKAYATAYEKVKRKEHPEVDENELNDIDDALMHIVENLDIDVLEIEDIFMHHLTNLTNKNNGHIAYLVKSKGNGPLQRIVESYELNSC